MVIAKIEEISIHLYNELRRKIINENPDKFDKKSKEPDDKYDGLKYILSYVPVISGSSGGGYSGSETTTKFKEEIRHISY
jgi:hypothetical protein